MDASFSAAAIAARVAKLRAWRSATATAQSIVAYRVLTNATLARLAATPVGTPAELLRVAGIGPVSLRTYGAELLALLSTGEEPDPSAVAVSVLGAAPPAVGADGPSFAEPPRLRAHPRGARPAAGWAPPAAFALALRGLKVRERVALDLYYGVTLGHPATPPEIAALLGVQETRADYHLQLGWNRLVRHATHPPATHPYPAAPAAVLAALAGPVEQV